MQGVHDFFFQLDWLFFFSRFGNPHLRQRCSGEKNVEVMFSLNVWDSKGCKLSNKWQPGDGCLQLVLQVGETQILFRSPPRKHNFRYTSIFASMKSSLIFNCIVHSWKLISSFCRKWKFHKVNIMETLGQLCRVLLRTITNKYPILHFVPLTFY